jgi:putative SOS response-associated peptidase YedK
MCGRYALTLKPKDVLEFVDVVEFGDFPARYNIAPTQPVFVVSSSERAQPGSNLPERRALLARWGFIPGWVKDPRDFPLLINARAETAEEKASFRAAMRHRRILIPASGFYEWRRPPKETGLKSQAYWIRPRNGGLMAFGGLMETYASAEGSELDTAAILTTKANAAIRGIHDRMPVVIPQREFSRWLDCRSQEPREVADLMQPVPDDFFEAVPVSDLVNKVANMGPELQKPIILAEPQEPPSKAAVKAGSGQMSLF